MNYKHYTYMHKHAHACVINYCICRVLLLLLYLSYRIKNFILELDGKFEEISFSMLYLS